MNHTLTSIYEACKSGDLEAVRRYLKHQFDVNATDDRGECTIHWATRGEHASKVFPIFVQHGVNVNARVEPGF